MIEILLPVYNGEKFLREQIESILNQTVQNWILKIRNDGSKDRSQEIIDEYCSNYPNKIIQIKSPQENVGLIQSLNYLIESEPHMDYIMFSDQDDVWLPFKIELSLYEIQSLEKSDTQIPAMICTDAICVDSYLNEINKSFFESQKFPRDTIGNINKMAALNVVQGCTIMINDAARSCISPFPSFLSMHDRWIGLNCANFGKIKYVYRPTLLYRQHSANTVGGKDINVNYYFSRFLKIRYTFESLLRLKKYFNLNLFKVIVYKIKYMLYRI